jgi:hypothetical protein
MVRDFDSSRRVTPPINADIVSMNETSSNAPTNASDSSANPQNLTPNIVSIIKSVSKQDRPALISEFAKQFNIQEDQFTKYMNLALENS